MVYFAGAIAQKYGILKMDNVKYIKTAEPLLFNTGKYPTYFYLLPAGTSMYKFLSFSEGHTTYIIYVDIKDDFAYENMDSDKPDLIDPIWTYTIENDEVSEMIAKAPISKDDLLRILRARKISRDELAQIVREWKD
jgi:hypothetical protein